MSGLLQAVVFLGTCVLSAWTQQSDCHYLVVMGTINQRYSEGYYRLMAPSDVIGMNCSNYPIYRQLTQNKPDYIFHLKNRRRVWVVGPRPCEALIGLAVYAQTPHPATEPGPWLEHSAALNGFTNSTGVSLTCTLHPCDTVLVLGDGSHAALEGFYERLVGACGHSYPYYRRQQEPPYPDVYLRYALLTDGFRGWVYTVDPCYAPTATHTVRWETRAPTPYGLRVPQAWEARRGSGVYERVSSMHVSCYIRIRPTPADGAPRLPTTLQPIPADVAARHALADSSGGGGGGNSGGGGGGGGGGNAQSTRRPWSPSTGPGYPSTRYETPAPPPSSGYSHSKSWTAGGGVSSPYPTQPPASPSTYRPVAPQPSTTQRTTTQPPPPQPTTKPFTTKPFTTKPFTTKPRTTQPPTTKPRTTKPPSTTPPTTKPSTTKQPTSLAPSTQRRTAQPPSTQKPIPTKPPTTQSPTVQPPLTKPPATTKPTTKPSTKKPPTIKPTAAPITNRPRATAVSTVEPNSTETLSQAAHNQSTTAQLPSVGDGGVGLTSTQPDQGQGTVTGTVISSAPTDARSAVLPLVCLLVAMVMRGVKY